MKMRRRLIRGAVVVLIGYVLGVIAVGAILCEGALRRPIVNESANLNPDEKPAAVTEDDGVKLRGVCMQPGSKPHGCILILHGVADTHFGMEGLARMFERDGYSVLLPDSRSHGWSGGALVTYGLKEAGDVRTYWCVPTAVKEFFPC